ncbi:perforin-1 [Pleuronectes platessa]|uniref:perforin-1 n=1 Tax=Pleuronectes platessa TaxID=8262 RepID=UPI00232A518B|nr:perforin-1 [Pleuronectes platessa]
MPAGKNQRSNFILLIMALSVMLEVCRVHGCWTGSGSECENAPPVQGYNLAGEGFDVVKMSRTGTYAINVTAYLDDNHTCTLCPNRFQNGQIQRLPAAVLDWRPFSRCSKQLSSGLHHSVDSLLRSSNSLVSNNWNVDLGLDNFGTAMLGGSKSELAKFAVQQHSEGMTTFATHELSCTFYSYRLADHPQLSTEFTKHLNQLPLSLNTSQDRAEYRRLIDTYGTHYLHQVKLGGRVKRITAFRTFPATLNGYSESEINECLKTEFQMALGLLPATASLSNTCDNILKGNMSVSMGSYQLFITHKTEVIGGDGGILNQQDPSEAYRSWMNSLHDKPDVVSYAILPLHRLVGDSQISANLKSIVTDYIKENQLHPASKSRPTRTGRGTLKLCNLRARRLNSDPFSATDAYVKIYYHKYYQYSDTIDDNNYPRWYETFDFGYVELSHKLKLEVWDEDVYYDDHIVTCSNYVERGTHDMICEFSQIPGSLEFTYSVT